MQIELKDVSFSYGKHPVLHRVSFSAEQGSLVAVLGPNGAGKSTLFRCILGLLKRYEGSITLCGRSVAQCPSHVMARLAAYIPQTSDPVFNYTVEDMVLMGATGALPAVRAPKKEQIDAAAKALEQLGIAHLAGCGICQISGGERQLALIARALVQQAKILIMDEPTANLDYGNQQRVLRQIQGLAAQGHTILLSTHNPEHALRYTSHVLALQNGAVCAAGKTEEVLTAELIHTLYGVSVTIAEYPAPDGTLVRSLVATE